MPGMADEGALAARCAVHPGAPAFDACPVCARPRCAADATLAPGGGCVACEGRVPRKGPPPLDLHALVRAGLACGLVAPLAGFIASEYVGATYVGVLVGAFVGVVLSIVAEAGAGKRRGPALRWLAVVYSLVAVGIGLAAPQASKSPFSPLWSGWDSVPLFYAAAALGSWAWTLPPTARKASRSAGSTGSLPPP
jgi:MFS family permease